MTETGIKKSETRSPSRGEGGSSGRNACRTEKAIIAHAVIGGFLTDVVSKVPRVPNIMAC